MSGANFRRLDNPDCDGVTWIVEVFMVDNSVVFVTDAETVCRKLYADLVDSNAGWVRFTNEVGESVAFQTQNIGFVTVGELRRR